MSRVKRLVESYERFIRGPWPPDAASAQRVIFCVYPESEELRVRAQVGEFELATQRGGHEWLCVDLTDSFPQWMATQKYAEKYFRMPSALNTVLHRYVDWLEACVRAEIEREGAGDNHVVALSGVGTLFELVRVKELVDRVAPLVEGRLLVFFPGSFENNNYRLLDGYDGWNYLATPIRADKDFLN